MKPVLKIRDAKPEKLKTVLRLPIEKSWSIKLISDRFLNESRSVIDFDILKALGLKIDPANELIVY